MLIKRGGLAHPKEAAVSDSDHQLLLTLVNNLSDGVLGLDTNLNIVMANTAALSLLDKNELKGLPLNKALALIDKTGKEIDPIVLIQSSPTGYTSRDLCLKFYDGSNLKLDISVAPVRLSYGASGGGFVMIMRDITSEKMVEDERDDFINIAGHELRTPVAIAEGSISNALLMAQRNGVSDTIVQSLKTAHDQTIFLSSMINDLSVLSRADRGQLAMNIEKFRVTELVQELANAYSSQARTKNLSLNFQVAPEAEELISSRLYVSEILQNLITNSLKYTINGGIQVDVLPATGGIQFSVIDSGIGISQSDLSKLFNKFFRSSDDRVKNEYGTGLGLYIAGKLADLLGTKIEVQSELNKGTTFSVVFPNLALAQKPTPHPDSPQVQPLANNP